MGDNLELCAIKAWAQLKDSHSRAEDYFFVGE